ncbi:pyridoxamine 5'-phosphate oxidase family protein [Bifidobacterium animalis subsp. animalis]|nr:pyridoxamine 5'-phosphate oxidase family protein [Bifidobacterium animalis]MCR1994915.1 pyridoxamine 5'-phosphate oxidase family protein [Bifidobacterium animalis subsp. animalis]
MHPSTPEKPSTARPMRRADREVRSFEEIIDILRNCTEVRVAYQDAQGLTIVPVNFAFVYNNDDSSHNLRLLMHSATQGRKIEAIHTSGNALPVAFEMDCDSLIYTGRTPCATSTAYRSIIGTGVASLLDDEHEKIDALKLLMKQRTDMHNVELLPRQVGKVTVWQIISTEFTAKAHPLPSGMR